MGLLKSNPHSPSVDQRALAGLLPVCSSPTRPAGGVLLLSLVRQVHSRKLSDANSAWEQESSQGHGFLP